MAQKITRIEGDELMISNPDKFSGFVITDLKSLPKFFHSNAS